MGPSKIKYLKNVNMRFQNFKEKACRSQSERGSLILPSDML
jgi:hypothetical protein